VFSRIPYEEAYSVNADGTDLKAISVMKAIGGPADWVSMSPDKSKLLLLNQQTLDLWCCNVDGTGVRQLTSGIGCYGAAWSPDGSKIAYIQGNGPYPRMFLMPASGLVTPPTTPSPLIPPVQISTGVEFQWSQPQFNHDGSRLVCRGYLPGTNQAGIYVIRDPLTSPSGSFITPTETSDGNVGFGDDISYCFHPTERDWLAISRNTGGGNRMLQMIKDDGSGLVNLPTPWGESFVEEIDWSDDGTEVVYCSNATWVTNYTPGTHTLSNPRQVAPFAGTIDW
jgi:hypothetical protein